MYNYLIVSFFLITPFLIALIWVSCGDRAGFARFYGSSNANSLLNMASIAIWDVHERFYLHMD